MSLYLTLTEVELKSNRKLLAALSLVTTAALGLTACGGGGDNGCLLYTSDAADDAPRV